MKLKISTLVFILFITNGFSQETQINGKRINPILSVNLDYSSLNNNIGNRVQLNRYSLSAGFQLDEKLDFSINFGFVNTQHLIQGLNKKVEALSNSLVFNYRFFKKCWVSPAFRFEAGYIITSNVKNKVVNDRIEIIQPATWNSSLVRYRFNRWGTNFSPQFLLSIKIKNVFFELGAGYNFMTYKCENIINNAEYSGRLSGMKLISTLKYRF